jgi:hypothetical protein
LLKNELILSPTPLPIPVVEKGEVTTALNKIFDYIFLD